MRFGVRVQGDGFTVRYKKTDGQPRFAFVVSTKVDKRATVRNRIRRIFSESVRLLLPTIAHSDVVVVVHKNIATTQVEAQTAITRAFKAAGLL